MQCVTSVSDRVAMFGRFLTRCIALLLALAMPAAAYAQLAVGMRLEDAGFKMKQANTPEKMARLRSIPARVFVPHRKNGQRYYVYADPDDCKCAYVGGEIAMKAYRDMAGPIPQPDDVGRSSSNAVREMQTEMDDESGTNFDDIFHPGF